VKTFASILAVSAGLAAFPAFADISASVVAYLNNEGGASLVPLINARPMCNGEQ
jgi:hypothetical protein